MRNLISKNVNLLKITIIGLFALFCVLYNENNVLAQEKQSEVSILCLTESQEYNENDLMELVQQMGEEFKVENVKDLVIGAEVDCFNLDTQEIIKYLPILHKNECVFVAVIEQNGKLSISNDTEFYQKLLDSYNVNETYLLYIEGNRIYAENENETLLLEDFSEGKKRKVPKVFSKSKFSEKVKYIKKKFDCELEEISTNQRKIKLENAKKSINVLNNIEEVNMPNLIYSDSSNAKTKKCGITNFVKQDEKNCWAAVVATIVNYKKNKNLTAKNVSDRMGITGGANLRQTRDALNLYRVPYKMRSNKLSWNSLCDNIDSDRPFGLGLKASVTDRHLVTGFGYAITSTGKKSVMLWDSNGFLRMMRYEGTEVSVTIDGKKFVWIETLY